jgi:hypothetical protein
MEEQDVLSTRRNIFDGDAFDMFSGNQVDKTKISRGKKGYANYLLLCFFPVVSIDMCIPY